MASQSRPTRPTSRGTDANEASASQAGPAAPVQNVYKIYHPQQVNFGNTNMIGHPQTGPQDNTGVQWLCQDSLLVALLKETLYHCPHKKEALYTLEEKLCAKLREVKHDRHIVSFQDCCGMPFRQFLENMSEHFEVEMRGNELIVSRVQDKPCGKGTSKVVSPSENQALAKSPLCQTQLGEGVYQPSEGGVTPENVHLKADAGTQKVIFTEPVQETHLPTAEGEPCEASPSTADEDNSAASSFATKSHQPIQLSNLGGNKSAASSFATKSHQPIQLSKLGGNKSAASRLAKDPNETTQLPNADGDILVAEGPCDLTQLPAVNADSAGDSQLVREPRSTVDNVGVSHPIEEPRSTADQLAVSNLAKESRDVKTQRPKPKADNFVASCLDKEPGDTLIFKLSNDAYKRDRAQLSLDIVSLWNTPDREEAFIVLGIQTLASHPHQLVGLRSGTTQAYYKKLFQSDWFDCQPEFNYREAMYEGKLVGIIQVGQSRAVVTPSLVKADVKTATPRLHKNELWVRKGGRNVALSGSDMNDALVKRVYSWFMMSPESTGFSASRELETQTNQMGAGDRGTCAALENSPTCMESENTPTSERRGSVSGSTTPVDIKVSVESVLHAKDASPSGIDHEIEQTSQLMKNLGCFKKGHFILLCGTLPHTVPNLNALSQAPWIAVYDFDVSSRRTGLLAYMEKNLRETRSTSVLTWMDPHTSVTERGTQWWSLRGRIDISDSILSDLTPKKWIQKVVDKVEKLCSELARCSLDYTLLTILVLWPNSKEEMKCMQMFLFKLQERIHVQPRIFLWFTDPSVNHRETFEVQIIVEDSENNVLQFDDDLGEFCSEVERAFSNAETGSFQFQLPPGGMESTILLKEALWLKQYCEVLYLQNPYTHTELTAEDLQAESDNFFRGGSINWFARYDMGANCFDVERGISKTIMRHIQSVYIDKCQGGFVQLLHAPGSGGSTMAQRILFNLHEVTPCVHVKQNSGSSAEGIAERLTFLSEHTHMPVVALFDGEDEHTLHQLRSLLRRCPIIFLCVKRYPHHIDPALSCNERENKFFLPGIVTKQESRLLAMQFGNHCGGVDIKRRALSALDKDVQQSKQTHQMFEYGLTVHSHEFQGVRAYVRGYLQMEHSALQPLQKCLGYLSLCYIYAHSSLPCRFVGRLIGDDAVFEISDLKHCVKMLVVPDTNEGKNHYVRIMHYTIAVEILEQILNPGGQSRDENLSHGAKQNLKDFCLEFLEQVVSDGMKSSFALQSILTKTFILRDWTLDEDSENRRKPQFSQIMLDLDSNAPFQGRQQILEKLCDVCPDDANLRAHLGRFYSLCRPEEEDKAEHNFKEAIRLATNTDNHSKTDMAHIYHMYGCFLQRKISRVIATETEPSIDSIIDAAEQACQKFAGCRSHAPVREAYHFFNELDVRLQVCRWVGQQFPGGFSVLLQPNSPCGLAFRFITENIVEIQDLFTACSKNFDLDNASLEELDKRTRKFNVIFRGCVKQLEELEDVDPLTALRLKIIAKKLQFDDSEHFVENRNMRQDVMEYIVDHYEQIFYKGRFCLDQGDKLEMDHRNWILAIRNPNFRKDYTVESVLEEVRRWRRYVRSPESLSTFYQFVLLSLLGFGTSRKPGHEECLTEARELKQAMRKEGGADPRARQPREWLSREDTSSIHRMISSSNIPLKHNRIKGAAAGRLAVCKGTVQGKPRPQVGFINLDVFQTNRHKVPTQQRPIQVFFVPVHSEEVAHARSTFMEGKRVQFHLGFTQENGYVAYEVKELNRWQCRCCGLWAEMTTDQTSVQCLGKNSKGQPCATEVFKH